MSDTVNMPNPLAARPKKSVALSGVAAGNTALLGAKLALFAADDTALSFAELRRRIAHVSLDEDPVFQETYAGEMRFPG